MSNDLLKLAKKYGAKIHWNDPGDSVEFWPDQLAAFVKALEAAKLEAQPVPPHECQTEGEKKAFAFGWWKALETVQPGEPTITSQESIWLTLREDLNPHTVNLIVRFARAMAKKLADAEKKYGYTDGWRSPDWMDECRAKLLEHVAKGDPRDVAAYCMFLWHHGEKTALPVEPVQPEWDQSIMQEVFELQGELEKLRAKNAAVALMILRNDRAETVKWAKGLLLKDSGGVEVDPGYAAPAAKVEFPVVIERIASGWDECMYDVAGVGYVDIGKAIRADFEAIAAQPDHRKTTNINQAGEPS